MRFGIMWGKRVHDKNCLQLWRNLAFSILGRIGAAANMSRLDIEMANDLIAFAELAFVTHLSCTAPNRRGHDKEGVPRTAISSIGIASPQAESPRPKLDHPMGIKTILIFLAIIALGLFFAAFNVYIPRSPAYCPSFSRHRFADRARLRIRQRATCLVPCCAGVMYAKLQREGLWNKFYMDAPARQRQCVEQYNIVKRA
jgi:hypothetical protein